MEEAAASCQQRFSGLQRLHLTHLVTEAFPRENLGPVNKELLLSPQSLSEWILSEQLNSAWRSLWLLAAQSSGTFACQAAESYLVVILSPLFAVVIES